MKVTEKYKIPQDKVINFNWNDQVYPADQKLIASIQYDLNNNIYHFFKNDEYVTIFNQRANNPYKKYYPSLTLPLEGVAWLLKTRYRFSLPIEESGLKGLGFKSVVKKEKLGMVVGVHSWTFFNYSRPSANDYDDRWCQALVWEFDFWRKKELQVLLHKIAESYPIQAGDVELLSPDDPFYSEEDSFDYDYVNGHLPNIKESL